MLSVDSRKHSIRAVQSMREMITDSSMRESMTSVEATAAGLMAVVGLVAAAAAVAGFSSIGVVVGTREVLRCLFGWIAKPPLIPLCSVDCCSAVIWLTTL